MDINDNDLYWLAGILEGEGSFMMSRNWVGGKLYLYPKVVVTMTDEDVIERAAHLFGTSVYKVPVSKSKGRENYKQQYRAQISGVRAAEVMVVLLSIMGNRRSEKIQEILDAYGEIESTEIRRKRSCQEAASKRMRNDAGRFIVSTP